MCSKKRAARDDVSTVLGSCGGDSGTWAQSNVRLGGDGVQRRRSKRRTAASLRTSANSCRQNCSKHQSSVTSLLLRQGSRHSIIYVSISLPEKVVFLGGAGVHDADLTPCVCVCVYYLAAAI